MKRKLLPSNFLIDSSFLLYNIIKSFEAFQQVLERLERVNYDGVDKRMGVFGDPAHCIERIKALQAEFQMDEFIGYFNQGGLVESATVRRSMELFATEVIPHCK